MLWLKLCLSLVLLAYLLWALDLTNILHILKAADWALFVAACLCLLVAQIFSAMRWTWLARGLGLTVRMARKIQLYFLGMFLSLFLPSILGGDVARGWLLAKGKKNAAWPAAASVILDRINGLLGLMLVVSFCMFFLDLPVLWMVLWNTACIVLLLVFSTLSWWWPRLINAAWVVRRQGKGSGWKNLQIDTPAFRTAWWACIPLTLVFQILVIQSHVFLGMAVGLQLSWFVYAFIVCLTALATALPLSFNGFGIREAGYIGLATWFGGASETAAAMAALWVLALLIVSFPGGLVLWRMGGSNIFKR
ncbi:MAG: flippase-like domain-containing protein [Mariprofundus sp.]|nr:flippase-like domain-containing protein [Mariprofundus sp.]